MDVKIVVDSAADLKQFPGVDYSSVPLKILAGEREYVDDANLDVPGMVADLKKYTGTSRTACPSAGEWMDAFEDKQYVFCITITSGLSGSYNAAMVAKGEYESMYPDRKVCVVDSLSTGPEMVLIADELNRLIASGLDFETVCAEIAAFRKHTNLLFMLGSLQNLARNGRVNPAVAKVAGVLGIRIVGKASDEGTLEPMHKCRGEKRSLQQIFELLEGMGYNGGRAYLGHCLNPEAAKQLETMICQRWPEAQLKVHELGGLCSFYAEETGILLAFEH